jgi:hypothetical protein
MKITIYDWSIKPTCIARNRLAEHLEKSEFPHEWDGDGYVAIDQSPEQDMTPLFRIVGDSVEAQEAYWEWSDARQFTAGTASDGRA